MRDWIAFAFRDFILFFFFYNEIPLCHWWNFTSRLNYGTVRYLHLLKISLSSYLDRFELSFYATEPSHYSDTIFLQLTTELAFRSLYLLFLTFHIMR